MVPGKPFCWHSLLDYHTGHWRKINWRAAWNTPILQCLPHPLNFLNSSLQQCLLRVAKVLVSSVNSGSLVLPLQPTDTESSWGSRSTISRYSPWLDLKRICTSAFRNRTHILTRAGVLAVCLPTRNNSKSAYASCYLCASTTASFLHRPYNKANDSRPFWAAGSKARSCMDPFSDHFCYQPPSFLKRFNCILAW